MKHLLHTLISNAIQQSKQTGLWPEDLPTPIQIERTKDNQHGHFSCNLGMLLAKPLRQAPQKIAQDIIQRLPTSEWVERVEVAGPGFINFYLRDALFWQQVSEILQQGSQYGRATELKPDRILLEFVSSNPTGPLHVGHGRSAAYGDVLANILEASGYQLHREYYVNDAGRQMDIITASIWLRYLELCEETTIPFPTHGYQGDYVRDIAKIAKVQFGLQLFRDLDIIFYQLPSPEEEAYIDALIARLKKSLGKDYRQLLDLGLSIILEDMRHDLADFGVEFNEWFSERGLIERSEVKQIIDELTSLGHTYLNEGALWFKSSQFGDDKDRVLIRENGQYTYFASDVAYHSNKLKRGATKLINILGSDHHGYYTRVVAALKALGHSEDCLLVLLLQFVSLYRGHEKVQMSTRGGSFITLRQLRQEVGNEATRFFYLLKRREQPIDFDLELAKKHSQDNPFYYIQYAHARICSVFRQLKEKNESWDQAVGRASLFLLNSEEEKQLMNTLCAYPEIIAQSAEQYEPNLLFQYLRQLATEFHSYYNSHVFLVDDQPLRQARLTLNAAVQQILRNGLELLRIHPMEHM